MKLLHLYLQEMGDPDRPLPCELLPTLALEWWIDKADFYDADNVRISFTMLTMFGFRLRC
jgi:hypothetical protein